jgi:hypothetical protein
MLMLRVLLVVSCLQCVSVSAQSYYPEITLNGDNPIKLGPVPEQFVDAGASCKYPNTRKRQRPYTLLLQ